MRAVSNAGPLISLARAGEFELLRRLFRRVVVPPAVYHEVAVRGRGHDGAAEVAAATWIDRRPPRRRELARVLGVFLGLGEAEAIALAVERLDSILLIDDAHGRRAARALGIAVKGTLGILLDGHRAGHVASVEAAVHRMRERGTWLSDEIVAAVIMAAKER